jgi:hypothetical protein
MSVFEHKETGKHPGCVLDGSGCEQRNALFPARVPTTGERMSRGKRVHHFIVEQYHVKPIEARRRLARARVSLEGCEVGFVKLDTADESHDLLEVPERHLVASSGDCG